MQLWTPEHVMAQIPAMLLMIVISVVLHIWLRKKSFTVRIIPLQVIAVLIVLLEVGKQAVSISRGYDLYHLPFHFCSLFIFMLPIAAFYRGRGAEKLRGLTAALCASVVLLMLIYPNLIFGPWDVTGFFGDYLAAHTVLFHNLVMLAFCLFPALALHEPVKGEIKLSVWFILGFSLVAAVMSQVFKTNYANMYTCNVPPAETLRLAIVDAIGYVPTQILYDAILAALNVLFVLLSYYLYRLILRAMKRIDERKKHG